MKITITGGAGYIGSTLAQQLCNNSDITEIQIIDNLQNHNFGVFQNLKSENTKKIKFAHIDILDARSVKKALKGTSVLIHLANLNEFKTQLTSHQFEQINHWGTSEIANQVEDLKIPKVIYLSSDKVYGFGDEIENIESINPQSFYAHATLRAENQLLRLKNSEVLILRTAEVYGSSVANHYQGTVNEMMFNAQIKGRIQIEGNGRNMMSILSLQNLLSAIEQLISKSIGSQIINISDKSLSVLDIVEHLQQIYPSLEFIFINPHLQIPNLTLKASDKWFNLKSDLQADLEQFKNAFSF